MIKYFFKSFELGTLSFDNKKNEFVYKSIFISTWDWGRHWGPEEHGVKEWREKYIVFRHVDFVKPEGHTWTIHFPFFKHNLMCVG